MTSVRKRKMARSSVKKNTRRVKDSSKRVVLKGHPLMAQYWDPKLTLIQNYKKLGLTVSLGKQNGGVERKLESVSERRARDVESDSDDDDASSATLGSDEVETDPLKIPAGEARIVRDPETNEVVKVVYGQMQPEQPEEKSEFSIVDKLEEYNKEHAKPVRDTKPSDREDHWLSQLHDKYGEDYERMKWDKKLNQTFMSAGQLKRKMAQWKKAHGI
ncbi:nucleolar protein 16 [Metschnikowia bicuspidata var. bicuspidata NRRL YB-4993]|uniref:Nucleolar protein 16 n=1 Tax=Metschnikowia bicuspidata var. bicuspidata NRRL YB-4993 TaxID=869754 RepID=A0A1A0HH82_9ASCO|nr:nucleolar protein 16 [Metschnikowia bicuspidata var. bicuspidata NRRL YB-4993]OBA23539.1 nucleolar protein 16 [Metschnikowia bicuspidata var. bicuspidata NRRL YB-4993]